MLLLMMELKGRFNSKMIKKAKFGEQYFDEMGAFDSIEKERLTGTVSPNFFLSVIIVYIDLLLRILFVKSTYRNLPEI